jgi:hypothetical protein
MSASCSLEYQKKDEAVKINVDALVMVDTMRFAECFLLQALSASCYHGK